WVARSGSADGLPHGGGVSDAAWADELLAGGWQRGLGCNPSRRVDAVSCPSALAEARFQWTTPRGLAGVRESAGEVPVPDRCELGQLGRQEDREHLQHGQSPATSRQEPALQQEEGR